MKLRDQDLISAGSTAGSVLERVLMGFSPLNELRSELMRHSAGDDTFWHEKYAYPITVNLNHAAPSDQ
jgi:hypothetical protein